MRRESVSALGALRYDAIRFRGPSVRMEGKPAGSAEKMPVPPAQGFGCQQRMLGERERKYEG